MVGFGPVGQRGVLHLDEVADVYLGPEPGARAQSGERADLCASAHGHAGRCAVDVGKRVNHGSGVDAGMGHHTMGTDAYTVTEHDIAFKHAVHVDLDILAAHQAAAHVQPRRVGQPHALRHQGIRHPTLVAPLQFGQLGRAVHARHLQRILNAMRQHGHSIGHGKLHHIGQVVLGLGVAVVQSGQPAA